MMKAHIKTIGLFLVSTVIILFLLILFYNSKSQTSASMEEEISFNQEKWRIHNGNTYPYRESMFRDVLYNDTIRTLAEPDILRLLGEPDRRKDNFLYYTISHSGIGAWTLHAKTMVIKFKENDQVDWIKVHE